MMNGLEVRVLHSCPVWLPRTQAWMYDQLRWLPPRIESHVACESRENPGEFPVANVHVFADEPSIRRRFDGALRRARIRQHLGFVARVARRVGARILHSHFGHVGWADRGAARAAGVRHVVTFYGADISQLPASDASWRRRYRALFDSVDLVLCEGPHMRRCAIELGCSPHKTKVHHLGVDVDSIPFEPRSWDGTGPLRVLLAGTFREKKGLPYAIDALGRLRAMGQPTELTIVGDAAGKPGDSDQKQRILATIHRHGLEPHCRLLGFQPHAVLTEEARRHHVFIAPSVTADDGDTEGGAPVSIIEMAAAGMPVIASTHCDIPNILTDGVSGLLVPERSSEAIVSKLRWLLDNPASWARLAEAARARIASDFNARVQGLKLAETYDAVL